MDSCSLSQVWMNRQKYCSRIIFSAWNLQNACIFNRFRLTKNSNFISLPSFIVKKIFRLLLLHVIYCKLFIFAYAVRTICTSNCDSNSLKIVSTKEKSSTLLLEHLFTCIYCMLVLFVCKCASMHVLYVYDFTYVRIL